MKNGRILNVRLDAAGSRARCPIAAACNQLQRGMHTSTRQLEADIRAFIEQHNEDPKPFKWTKSADDILAAVKRFCRSKLMPRTLDSGD